MLSITLKQWLCVDFLDFPGITQYTTTPTSLIVSSAGIWWAITSNFFLVLSWYFQKRCPICKDLVKGGSSVSHVGQTHNEVKSTFFSTFTLFLIKWLSGGKIPSRLSQDPHVSPGEGRCQEEKNEGRGGSQPHRGLPRNPLWLESCHQADWRRRGRRGDTKDHHRWIWDRGYHRRWRATFRFSGRPRHHARLLW